MKYGTGLASARINITTRKRSLTLGGTKPRKGPRMPSLMTPNGRISTNIAKI